MVLRKNVAPACLLRPSTRGAETATRTRAASAADSRGTPDPDRCAPGAGRRHAKQSLRAVKQDKMKEPDDWSSEDSAENRQEAGRAARSCNPREAVHEQETEQALSDRVMPKQRGIVEDDTPPMAQQAGKAARDGKARHDDEREHKLKLKKRSHVNECRMRVGFRTKAGAPVREDFDAETSAKQRDRQANCSDECCPVAKSLRKNAACYDDQAAACAEQKSRNEWPGGVRQLLRLRPDLRRDRPKEKIRKHQGKEERAGHEQQDDHRPPGMREGAADIGRNLDAVANLGTRERLGIAAPHPDQDHHQREHARDDCQRRQDLTVSSMKKPAVKTAPSSGVQPSPGRR